MTEWFSDGKQLTQIAPSDRGFQYGDGLFETIAIRSGEPRLWDYHVERLANGCKQLHIEMPSPGKLYEGVMHAVAESGVPGAYCISKIIVSAGATLRGYGRQFIDTPSVIFAAFPTAPAPVEAYREGIETVLCVTRLALNSATAGLKTLNRIEQVLAHSEIAGSGVFEGLTMDADDRIICGTMSNLFVISDGEIVTPSLHSNGVEGVMRHYIMDTLGAQGIKTAIQSIKRDDLKSADEVFICNSQFGVMPVRRCMDSSWPVGSMTKQVMTILADHGISECRV